MKTKYAPLLALLIATTTTADSYQYKDCDGNCTLLLTELDAEPGVNLSELYLGCAELTNANLISANLTNANLYGAYGWEYATQRGATYNDATIFPEGMIPEKFGMIYDDTADVTEGACCVTSGCDVVEETMCTNFGGTWTETGSCDDCVTPPETCDADLANNGEVNIDDLLLLIGAWGVCP